MNQEPIDRDTFLKEFGLRLALQVCCLTPLYLIYLKMGAKGQVAMQIYILAVAFALAVAFFRQWDLILGRLRHLFPHSEPPSKKALGVILYLPVSCLLFYSYLAFANEPRGQDNLPWVFRRPKKAAALLIAINFGLPALSSYASAEKADKLTFWGSSPSLFALNQVGKDFQFGRELRAQIESHQPLNIPEACDEKIQSGVGRLFAITLVSEQTARAPASEQGVALEDREHLVDDSIKILKGWDAAPALITRLNPMFALSPTALPEAIVVTALNRLSETYLSVVYLSALRRQMEFARVDSESADKIDQWKKSIAPTRQAKTVAANEGNWVGHFFPYVRAKVLGTPDS